MRQHDGTPDNHHQQPQTTAPSTGKTLGMVIKIDNKQKELEVNEINTTNCQVANVLTWEHMEDHLDGSSKDLRFKLS